MTLRDPVRNLTTGFWLRVEKSLQEFASVVSVGPAMATPRL